MMIIFLGLVVLSFSICVAIIIAQKGNKNVMIDDNCVHEKVDSILKNEIYDDEII